MSQHLTLYVIKDSPFSRKVEIAVQEAGAEVTKYEVAPGDVPAWYVEKINPLGKVPAITYGPQHPPEHPAPESVKINESLIIVEFIADLYPNSTLLPKDPVLKAQARVFASLIDSAIILPLQATIFTGTSDMSELFKALDLVQSRLPDDALYAVGNDFTIADVSAAPFLVMIEIMLKNDIGAFKKGDGLKAFELFSSLKYDKLRNYVTRLQERPSVKKIIDSDIKLLEDILSKKFPRV